MVSKTPSKYTKVGMYKGTALYQKDNKTLYLKSGNKFLSFLRFIK